MNPIQARLPAPATGNIATNHDVGAKKFAHAPPIHLESDQATPRLADPHDDNLNPMTYGGKDVHNMWRRRCTEYAPKPQESERAKPGALRMGGQNNDDGNTVTFGEAVRSHCTTIDAFRVSARLVEEDLEERIGVAVLAKDEGGNKKLLMHILIGISVIFVIVAIVLGVTLTTISFRSGTPLSRTPAPTRDPQSEPMLATQKGKKDKRDSTIALIHSRSSSTSFSDLSSPQSQALDWILADLYSSDGLSDDRLVQRFALATVSFTSDVILDPLEPLNECDWYGNSLHCSPESVVERLDLSGLAIMGRIPIGIGLLINLAHLDLSYNELTGPLPSEFALLTQLERLFLWDNQLTGSFPSEFGHLTKLTDLLLSFNELTGSLPSELALLTQLTYLRLHGNELTCSMPSSLCSSGLMDIVIDCGEIACTCCRSNVGHSCSGRTRL